MTKQCGRCRAEKAIDQFSKNHGQCKKCRSEIQSARAATDPERQRALSRDWYRRNRATRLPKVREQMKQKYRTDARFRHEANVRRIARNYGITWEQVLAQLEAQGGTCASCGDPISLGAAHIDHCHESTAVRGLLCRACNLAAGCALDDPARLRRLADYVEQGGRWTSGPQALPARKQNLQKKRIA
jgi:RNA polymerase-binding transcription factor DksA